MRTWLAALLFALALGSPALAQQALSPAEFRDAAIAMIRANDPRAEVQVRDELSLNVRRPHEKALPEFYLNLDNAYREYQGDPRALNDILDRWVRVATTPPESNQMAERIVSVLRPRALVEDYHREAAQARANSNLPPSQLVWRPFAGDLVEIIVFDGAETIQYALVESLAEIGVTPERSWELAPTNLAARLGELEIGGVDGGDRLAYVTGGNGLAPSSLTNGGGVCNDRDARLLFLIVERNGYVVADGGDSVALRQFGDLLNELRRGGDAFSLTPLGCREGRVVEVALTD